MRRHGLQGHCILREKKPEKTSPSQHSLVGHFAVNCEMCFPAYRHMFRQRNPKPNNLSQKFDRQKCRERLRHSWPELISIHISTLKCKTEIQLHKRKQRYQNAQNQVCALKVQTTVAKKQRKTRERERGHILRQVTTTKL